MNRPVKLSEMSDLSKTSYQMYRKRVCIQHNAGLLKIYEQTQINLNIRQHHSLLISSYARDNVYPYSQIL